MSNTDAQFAPIGRRLAAIRASFSDLNQKEWASLHGFNHTQWHNWEKGTRRITLDAAEILVARYGLTLDAIYLGRVDGLSEKASKIF